MSGADTNKPVDTLTGTPAHSQAFLLVTAVMTGYLSYSVDLLLYQKDDRTELFLVFPHHSVSVSLHEKADVSIKVASDFYI